MRPRGTCQLNSISQTRPITSKKWPKCSKSTTLSKYYSIFFARLISKRFLLVEWICVRFRRFTGSTALTEYSLWSIARATASMTWRKTKRIESIRIKYAIKLSSYLTYDVVCENIFFQDRWATGRHFQRVDIFTRICSHRSASRQCLN